VNRVVADSELFIIHLRLRMLNLYCGEKFGSVSLSPKMTAEQWQLLFRSEFHVVSLSSVHLALNFDLILYFVHQKMDESADSTYFGWNLTFSLPC
jgi:hypothetical protein